MKILCKTPFIPEDQPNVLEELIKKEDMVWDETIIDTTYVCCANKSSENCTTVNLMDGTRITTDIPWEKYKEYNATISL